MKKLIILITITINFIPLNYSYAAENYLCASVIPNCDKEGNPVSPFDDSLSPCFEYFWQQCLLQKIELMGNKIRKLEVTLRKDSQCKKAIKK